MFVFAAALTLWSMQAGQPPALATQQPRAALDRALAATTELLLPVTKALAIVVKDVSDRGYGTPDQLRAALARREFAETLLAPLRRLPQGGSAVILDPSGRPLTLVPLGGLADLAALKAGPGALASPWVVPLSSPGGTSAGLIFGSRLLSSQGVWLGTVVVTSPLPAISAGPEQAGTGLRIWLAAGDGTLGAGPPALPGPAAMREPSQVAGLILVSEPASPVPASPVPASAVPTSAVPASALPASLLPAVPGPAEGALMAALASAGLLAAAALLRANPRGPPERDSPSPAGPDAGRVATVDLMLDHMDQGVMLIGQDRTVEVCNRRATELFQLPPEMMASRPSLDDVLSYQWGRGLFAQTSNTTRLLIRKASFPATVERYERQTTQGRTIEVLSVPLPAGGMVRTVTDITERKAAEHSLAFVAQHDELTQLANRATVRDRLEQQLVAAKGLAAEIAVLYLDLDRFKLVNDTRGHAVGDALLTQVGLRLRQTVRAGDLVGRIGGDEFAILLLNTCGNAVVDSIATDLLNCIAEPYTIDGEVSLIGISIGVALFPGHGTTADDLLRNADSALYRAKHAGRGVVRFFESADDVLDRTRLQLENDLRSALERRQFELAYQPIVSCVTGEPVAFEALLRWHHPERGLVAPAEFIPVAEETGLIGPIGLWVMETACREAVSWPSGIRIAINLSPAQFRQHDLEAQIAAILERTGLSPARLDLEVTEGVLLARTDAVRRAMQALKQRGIRLVLDDFGTANSSFSYLLSFPFAQIKIDKSFVWALSTDASAKAIVEAMLGIARAMKLDVVAEGVESEAQCAWVQALGCGYAQGNLFGSPAPGRDAQAYLSGAGRPPAALFNKPALR